ncbi:Gfo/Idh/MocA family protein [Cellulosilyticum sp. I15G10I2]|uniref:Gfo/Idh/MocA family protein n=1 Tax=Cellulosilyticum sp. I15G10I2 TaxID=1892843 RepID=UPI00085C564E|nr:Gfo/Idh/MocA family oxidoreductase [Cellulosilyticum sp. I15G10I2]
MRLEKLGVGIIGASANGSWASMSHIPALQSLECFEVTAVGTSSIESAKKSSEMYHIANYFADPYELAMHPDVDIVIIAVKVPYHYELIQKVLKAGKHVYSEFPLTSTTEQAVSLLNLAKQKGIRHTLGLQARSNPTMNYLKFLLTESYIGEIRSVNVSYSMTGFPIQNGVVPQSHTYLLNEDSGADQLTITAGHLLDGLNYLMGDFTHLSAFLDTQIKQLRVKETDEIITATSPDSVIIYGELTNKALVTLHVRNSFLPHFAIEINGTKGDITLTPKDGLMYEMDTLILKSSQDKNSPLKRMEIPKEYFFPNINVSNIPAYNVAYHYTNFYNDITLNTHKTPDFETGVRLHKLFDKIRESSKFNKLHAIEV